MNLTTLTLAGSVYKHPTKKPKREIVDTWTSHLLTLTNSCSSNSYWRTWTRNSWWFEDCCHFLRKCWSWGTVHISPSQYSFRTLYLYLYLPNCVVLMSITNPYNYIQSCLLEITLTVYTTNLQHQIRFEENDLELLLTKLRFPWM